MRTRVLLSGGAVVAVTLLGVPGVAHAAAKSDEISKCLEEKQAAHQTDYSTCQKAPNPILPATSEIIWGAISFVVLFFLLAKFAWPGLKKALDARADKIRESLDEAERARTEAETVLEDYQRQVADAKSEAARIIEEARQTADNLRQDLRRQAEAEVAELKQRAQEDIQAQVDRAMADLRSQVGELAIELAEKVVERNLDHATQMALIDSFISQVGSPSA
ncbi:MAG: synthase, subunit b [Acidimicrobiales bacterium]|nr:synthase, subunit b [Acidimicrobiales bacterium]